MAAFPSPDEDAGLASLDSEQITRRQRASGQHTNGVDAHLMIGLLASPA
jgi:hypothetical protein